MRISSLYSLGVMVCVVSQAAFAPALLINDYSDTRNNRFSGGYPSSPVANTSGEFIGAGHDFSGVGWRSDDGGRSYGLLGPRHFLYAVHYAPGIGSTINFSPSDNVVVGHEVAEQSGSLDGGDLAVGMFAEPVSPEDNINHYSVLFNGYGDAPYVGSNLLMYGHTSRVGWGRVDGVVTEVVSKYLDFAFDETTPDRATLVGGDSGSPSFIVDGRDGEMYISGAHYGIYNEGTRGVDSSLAHTLPEVNAHMARTGYLPYVVTPTTARWQGGSSSSWGLADNWSSAVVPGDTLQSGKVVTCASLLFDGAATSMHSIDLGGNRTVTGITFARSAGTNPFTIAGSDTLTIGEAGLANLDSEAQTLQSPLILRASQRWDVGRGGLLVSGAVDTGAAGYLLLIEGQGDTALSGQISGNGGLAVHGPGAVTLDSAGNTYNGKTFINGGTLVIGRDDHLGTAPDTLVSDQLTIDGGTLRVTSTFNMNNHRGTMIGQRGATILVDDANTLQVRSPLAGDNTSLVHAGPGSLLLMATNTLSGEVHVDGGLMTISGPSGSLAAVSTLNIHSGALILENYASNNSAPQNRIADNASLLLSNSFFTVLGNVAGTTETLGALYARHGENTVNLLGIFSPSTTTFASLTRDPAASLTFNTDPLSGSKIVISGVASGFIDQGTFYNGTDYAVYDATGYVRIMQPGSGIDDYATTLEANRHVRLSASPMPQDDLTLLTLNLAFGGIDLTLNGGSLLTLTDGGIIKSRGGTGASISGGDGLTTGTEYVIRTDIEPDTLLINCPLTGGTGLTKSGTGTLILGDSGNTYGGDTTVTSGLLQLAASEVIPDGSSLIIRGTALVDLAGHDETVAHVALEDGQLTDSTAAAALWLGGNVGTVTCEGVSGGANIAVGRLNLATAGAASGSHQFKVADGLADVDLAISAVIADGSGNSQSLSKTGTGTLRLDAANTYSGDTTILEGTLTLGTSNAIADVSNLTVDGGTLALGAFLDTLGAVVLNDGSISGTTGALSGSSYDLRNGTVDVVLGGTAAVIKTAAGTVVLNAQNTYSGGTNIQQGVLEVTSDGNLGDVSGGLIFSGGTLRIVGTSFNNSARAINWSIAGGGFDIADEDTTFTIDSTQNLIGGGSLEKAGPGTLQLDGTVQCDRVSVKDGTLLLGGSNRLSDSPHVAVSSVATFDLEGYDETIGSLEMTGGAVDSAGGMLTVAGGIEYHRSIWPATISGTLDFAAQTRTIHVEHGTATDLTISANIIGSGGFNKTGTGILTVSGNNLHTGESIVSEGTLLLYNEAGLGSAVAGTTVSDGGTLDLFGKNIGNEPLTLSGDGIDQSGALANSQISSTAKVGGNVLLGGDTTINTAADIEITGTISGNYGLSKIGSKTLLLGGSQANTYLGDTSISGGMLKFGKANAIGSAPSTVTVDNYGTLNLNGFDLVGKTLAIDSYGINGYGGLTNGNAVNTAHIDGNVILQGSTYIGGAGNTTINGQISGDYGFSKLGSGTLRLEGTQANSYSGNTVVKDGTLLLGKQDALGTGPLLYVEDGATLDLGGFDVDEKLAWIEGAGTDGRGSLLNDEPETHSTFDAPVTMTGDSVIGGSGNMTISDTISGSAGLVKLGSGYLELTGSNDYTGPTIVSEGTLVISGSGSINGTSGIEVDGGSLFLDSSETIEASIDITNGSLFGNGTINGSLVIGVGGIIGAESDSFGGGLSGSSIAIEETVAAASTNPSDDFTPTSSDILVTTVPEPTTAGLLATALLCMLGYARRRRVFHSH